MDAPTSPQPAPQHALPPNPGQFFRHTDGGYYHSLGHALHADDQAVHVIYEHIWPFETGLPWLRRVDEWAGRFTPVTREQLIEAMQQDRESAQAAVMAAKAARRAAAGA
jgi:hypothetical protein